MLELANQGIPVQFSPAAGFFPPKPGFPDPELLIRESFHNVTVSLCMIVKNEQYNLGRAIESVRLIADEIVVVDAGSTDNSAQAAEALGAHVFHYSWNHNFSEARNFSLDHATKDWILVLDADETIAYRDLFYLKEIAQNTEFWGFALDQRDYTNLKILGGRNSRDDDYEESKPFKGWKEQQVVRFFRNLPKLRFCFPVYEIIEKAIKDNGGEFAYLDVPIHHYGRLAGFDEQRNKRKYYIEILKKHLSTELSNDERALTCTNLFSAYSFLGEHDTAYDYLVQAEKCAPSDPYLSVVYVHLGKSAMMRNDVPMAIMWLEKSLKLEKRNPELYPLLIQCYLTAGRIADAQRMMQRRLMAE
jgi:glycosyltransferase involved in cell wall biosynthesis